MLDFRSVSWSKLENFYQRIVFMDVVLGRLVVLDSEGIPENERDWDCYFGVPRFESQTTKFISYPA